MIERILIAVKTYPTLSSKYAELVCTAGVNESGEWRRIYPVCFRQLQDGSQYQKYQWVEADIEKSTTDGRPESYKIKNPDSLKLIGGPIPTADKWLARKEAFHNQVALETNIAELIEQAHGNLASLAHYKPQEMTDFVVEKTDREWNPKKLELLEAQKQQFDLFKDEATIEEEFKVVKKLPYKFSYKFKDVSGKTPKLMIEDWEIGALYWNCLKNADGDEAVAVQKVREKYWDTFVQSGKYDLTLVLGTTLQHHNKRAPNPYVIISVVPTPYDAQTLLF
ncbi:hypothetical protein SH580_10505 [Coraliomargarita algicola]|uniref:Uncharacterized protein n=1 Tax=Coraliomargarita algicola TaxID=3092156 RepID=A0ABZ0RPI8_9BACT|nr:hypothetical protein [Coraliomargarita sp. J2-16]WPJ98130.1 hypothetical protein SH580_10505 [Coraliomargarita sp. J2-16]